MAPVVLVTGASGSFGGAVARAAGAAGATVILSGRNVAKLEGLYDDLIAAGAPKPAIYPLDLIKTTTESGDLLVRAVEQEFGRLDALVHCAAELGTLGPIGDIADRDWQRLLLVNLYAPFALTRSLLPMLTASAGVVVFVGDSAAMGGKAFWGAYGIAKAGLMALADTLAAETESSAFKVRWFTPGPMRSSIRHRAFPAEAADRLASADDAATRLLELLRPIFSGGFVSLPTRQANDMQGYGRESIVLLRDVSVIQIPDGSASELPAGHVVTLYQSLGGNYTVTTETGSMVRIAGQDADALGKEPATVAALAEGIDAESIEQNVWSVLRTIFDPEIPVNIVDLGLVYHCKVTRNGQGKHDVHVIMTLTAPGCGMGPVLQYDAEAGIKNLPGVDTVNIEVVFDPPWSRDMMSEVAQLQLGMI